MVLIQESDMDFFDRLYKILTTEPIRTIAFYVYYFFKQYQDDDDKNFVKVIKFIKIYSKLESANSLILVFRQH